MTPTPLTSEELEQIARILREACGVSLSEGIRASLQTSFRDAAASMGMESRVYFQRLLASDADCVAMLVEHSVVGETYLYRHPEHFAALRRYLVEAHDPARGLRVWCAGCATGEEPYTVAMLLQELGRRVGPDTIVATDVSERALLRAQAGTYGAWSLRRIDPAVQQRFFRGELPRMELADTVRRQVVFRKHNLLSDPAPLTDCDVVLCRNVLIYFDAETASRVLHKLVESLRPGGMLVLGIAELPLAMPLALEWLDVDGATILRRPEAPRGQGANRDWPPRAARPTGASRPHPAPVRTAVTARPAARVGGVASAKVPPPAQSEETTLGPAEDGAFAQARLAARQGRVHEAEDIARRLAREELLPEAFLLLSMIAESRGDLTAAVEGARRALYLDSSLALGHAALVTLFRRMGRTDEAERARANALQVLEGVEDAAELRGVETISAGALRRALEVTETGTEATFSRG